MEGIAAMSMGMSDSYLQQSVNISVLKKAMSAQQTEMQTLLSAMPAPAQAPPQSFGHLLDVRA